MEGGHTRILEVDVLTERVRLLKPARNPQLRCKWADRPPAPAPFEQIEGMSRVARRDGGNKDALLGLQQRDVDEGVERDGTLDDALGPVRGHGEREASARGAPADGEAREVPVVPPAENVRDDVLDVVVSCGEGMGGTLGLQHVGKQTKKACSLPLGIVSVDDDATRPQRDLRRKLCLSTRMVSLATLLREEGRTWGIRRSRNHIHER